jgi:hypothetical protein
MGATTVNGVNDQGDLVGFYVDSAGNTDGMLVTPGRGPSETVTTSTTTTSSQTGASAPVMPIGWDLQKNINAA